MKNIMHIFKMYGWNNIFVLQGAMITGYVVSYLFLSYMMNG